MAERVFTDEQRARAETIAEVVYCNPFGSRRIEFERAALGSAFNLDEADWNVRFDAVDEPSNVTQLIALAERVLDDAKLRIEQGARLREAEAQVYEDLAVFVVYHRWRPRLDAQFQGSISGALRKARVSDYQKFEAELGGYINAGGEQRRSAEWLAHAFAVMFQIRRAFNNIYNFIIGASRPTARLREAVWESIFTHDLRRYRRVLFGRMGDYATLVTGESGTGKELVARAVGLSRYIPFDRDRQMFAADFATSFAAVNLSALSETLIESELFGHKRGAFTGAVADRAGWLETVDESGTVFLDEIGELSPVIQVKLLRVLQSRTFSRLGESQDRQFKGKIIAATNRNLAERMQSGDMRNDFYYRLCSDTIHTPALRDRLADDPAERGALVEFITRRIVGEEECDAITREVESWIDANLGAKYQWPGNVRELEQCVRNVLIRGSYTPALVQGAFGQSASAHDEVMQRMRLGEMSADELLSAYCTLVYAREGTYEGAAKRLGVDRRTVSAKVDADLLAKLR